MNNFVAFIPVRGGSKSIPMKNIKNFCDRPLVYWTAKAANDSSYINRVYISTDSDMIKEKALSFGFPKVEVIKRSAGTASDTASTESAMLEFANNFLFERVILIQATSPLLCKDDLDGGCEKYLNGCYDSLLSVVRQKRFIWRLEDSIAYPVNYDPAKRPRRQEQEGYMVENGAFYITSRERLMRTKCRISGKIGLYEMPEKTYFEIDEPNDWLIMEKLKAEELRKEVSFR